MLIIMTPTFQNFTNLHYVVIVVRPWTFRSANAAPGRKICSFNSHEVASEARWATCCRTDSSIASHYDVATRLNRLRQEAEGSNNNNNTNRAVTPSHTNAASAISSLVGA